jgi:two-component system cell cycle response regulator
MLAEKKPGTRPATAKWPGPLAWLGGPPDPSVLELGREGEVLVAKVRIGLATAGLLTVLLVPPLESRTFVGGYSAMLLVAVSVLLLARRAEPVRGLGLFSCLLDVSLVTLIHAAVVLAGSPLLATNSRAVFNVYFLVLSLTCLRLDVRLCVTAGLTAVLQYGGMVLWVAHSWNLRDPQFAQDPSGAFRWDNQVARLLLLGIATAVNAALVTQGRKYWTASVHDHLTGLHNRGYAESRLAEAIAQARRSGRTVVVALADLDRFKAVNDRWGHAAGDEVLRHTADLLRRSFRASDVIARYGGEEFLLAFPEIEPQAARERIEGFRASFAAAAAPPVPVALTLSIGVAAYPGDGETTADLLGRADERLYAAKQAGRNRVEGWSRSA